MPLSELYAQTLQQHRRTDVAQMRFVVALLGFASVLFFVLDAFVTQSERPPVGVIALRLVFIAVSAWFWAVLPRLPEDRPFDGYAMLWALLGLAVMIANATIRSPSYFGHYVHEVCALLVFFAATPISAHRKLFIGLVYVTAALTLLLVRKQPPHPLYVPNTVLTILLATVAGYLVALRLDRYRDAALNARLELERAARSDVLTGIANRRAFMQWAYRKVARQERDEGPGLAVLLIDVDLFKSVNDSFGHAAGDQLLVELVRRISTVVRIYDAVARMGGDEFVVGLPRCDLSAALRTAERIREVVTASPFDLGGESISVTVSIGAAVLHPGESEIDAALGRADAAMYLAKRQGRNRIEAEADA
ncbi:MAG: GGDEF domain-containing protein [Casimicrobiaceae bacterium]|nr:GGDEF domain-containing protein [Casimicrobiaceae bacterium]